MSAFLDDVTGTAAPYVYVVYNSKTVNDLAIARGRHWDGNRPSRRLSLARGEWRQRWPHCPSQPPVFSVTGTVNGEGTVTSISSTGQMFTPSLVGGGSINYGGFTPFLAATKSLAIQWKRCRIGFNVRAIIIARCHCRSWLLLAPLPAFRRSDPWFNQLAVNSWMTAYPDTLGLNVTAE